MGAISIAAGPLPLALLGDRRLAALRRPPLALRGERMPLAGVAGLAVMAVLLNARRNPRTGSPPPASATPSADVQAGAFPVPPLPAAHTTKEQSHA